MTHSDKTLLEKFDYIIDENLENSSFSTDKVCLDLGLSRSQLHRINGDATEMALSPNGKEMAFVFRGEVFVTSTENNQTKRITNTPA
jgi:AraC-like DNA-binding protein